MRRSSAPHAWKRLAAVAAACAMLVMSLGLLAGCSGGEQEQSTDTQAADAQQQGTADDKIEVVCATFPAYDWTMQVIGDQADRFDVTYLMDSGVDLHSYQPTVEDVAKIADCDLFVYVGGESDDWAADALANATNPDIHSVNMLEAVGEAAVEEEVVEGMEADEDEHADADDDADEEEGPEYDEHVWLSLRNANMIVTDIYAKLADIDPDNAEAYEHNAALYIGKLDELGVRYTEAVEAGAADTVVFADRFPFRYLMDEFGLSYYAAFSGCSAETEASFETIAFLANKVDELGLGAVLVIENSDEGIARTVIENTADANQQILVMNSLQSATAEDIGNGMTYLGVMEDNLDVLKTALG